VIFEAKLFEPLFFYLFHRISILWPAPFAFLEMQRKSLLGNPIELIQTMLGIAFGRGKKP
jgi:hypothetical protein